MYSREACPRLFTSNIQWDDEKVPDLFTYGIDIIGIEGEASLEFDPFGTCQRFAPRLNGGSLGAPGIPKFFDTLTLMKRVPITLENETTTLVGRVELRVTRQKCIKNVGSRRLRA